MEKYRVTFKYVLVVNDSDTETKERTRAVDVGIGEKDPFTEVFDRAYEELSDKVGECEVLDYDITNLD